MATRYTNIVVINKGMRDRSWFPDDRRQLTQSAEHLMNIILEASADGRESFDVPTLAEVLQLGAESEWTDEFRDSFQELLDLGCLRVARIALTVPPSLAQTRPFNMST